MPNSPTPYDPNVSPELAVLTRLRANEYVSPVARAADLAKLPITVGWSPDDYHNGAYWVDAPGFHAVYFTASGARKRVIRERTKLLAAYLPAAPERGMIVDREV